jgi:hypothetical protein
MDGAVVFAATERQIEVASLGHSVCIRRDQKRAMTGFAEAEGIEFGTNGRHRRWTLIEA